MQSKKHVNEDWKMVTEKAERFESAGRRRVLRAFYALEYGNRIFTYIHLK